MNGTVRIQQLTACTMAVDNKFLAAKRYLE
jgi:hypothetical protein